LLDEWRHRITEQLRLITMEDASCRSLAPRVRSPIDHRKQTACELRETAAVTDTGELRVLGQMGLHVDGESVPLGGPKAQQLLSVLAAHRDDPVSSDRLVDSLWGDQPPRSARATVQTQVSRLRAVLPPDFSIALEPTGYRLGTPENGLDACRFETLLTRCRSLPDRASVAVLDEARSLWRGPAFGQHAELPEVQGEAIRLDELRLVATDEWARTRIDLGESASMVGELEALVTEHPLRESYWRMLMLALHLTGRQGEALRRADHYRTMLGEDLGLDVSSAVKDLEADILSDNPSLRPPGDARAKPQQAIGLGLQLMGATSFIGRDPDVIALGAALADHQVLTVTGPGGVGKTRLALRVAGEAMAAFADGVVIVELAPLRDPSGSAQVLAHALDIQQRQFRTLESTIEDHLTTRNCLLVLDNCEHVTDTIAPIADRLRSVCPHLRILATSREPLGLAGEYVEVLAPLSLPPSGMVTADEIRNSPAAQLLVSRAKAATPEFRLTDENAPAVAEICRRLDGLPLAMELAAARLRSMGVDALAESLRERSDLHGQTQRGADGRQRSLHHLVEWSHDLLEPHEQATFEQLAVFAGGFDLAAAEAVCATEGDVPSTLGTLAGLVEKSMVSFVDPRPTRYRLLEPLREFGRERLRRRGALSAVEDRHMRWFVDQAERGAVGLDGADEPIWSAALRADFDNLRAAHLTAVQREDADAALRLVSALREYAFRRVVYEVVSWADASVALEDAGGHPDLATALAVSAYGRFVRGDMESAVSRASEAVAAGQSAGLAERVLGNAHFYMEEVDEGLAWMDRMLEAARQSGSNPRIAHAFYMRSVAATSVGDGIRGAVLAGEASAAARVVQSPTSFAQADYALGLAIESTDPSEALRCLEQASTVGSTAGNRWLEAFALTEVHWLRAKEGNHLEALVGFADIVETWYRGGDWANQ
jgi:predicted ATPase/DNA-binding SARP family transcriptional activator